MRATPVGEEFVHRQLTLTSVIQFALDLNIVRQKSGERFWLCLTCRCFQLVCLASDLADWLAQNSFSSDSTDKINMAGEYSPRDLLQR